MFNKGGNIIFEGMKIFQVRENKPQQISIFPMKIVKGLQKNGIIQAIKHVFVWCIVYKQHVANVNVNKCKKENIKVLMENWFVKFNR
jgi:hypothetical protein